MVPYKLQWQFFFHHYLVELIPKDNNGTNTSTMYTSITIISFVFLLSYAKACSMLNNVFYRCPFNSCFKIHDVNLDKDRSTVYEIKAVSSVTLSQYHSPLFTSLKNEMIFQLYNCVGIQCPILLR